MGQKQPFLWPFPMSQTVKTFTVRVKISELNISKDHATIGDVIEVTYAAIFIINSGREISVDLLGKRQKNDKLRMNFLEI